MARFSREELEIACMDAHMSGRVYANGGEQRKPGDEHLYMLNHAMAAVERYRREQNKLARKGIIPKRRKTSKPVTEEAQ